MNAKLKLDEDKCWMKTNAESENDIEGKHECMTTGNCPSIQYNCDNQKICHMYGHIISSACINNGDNQETGYCVPMH